MSKKILILDDDADILDILSYLIKEEGYEIHALAHGENIWESLRTFSPDLVLMDLMLADLDGRSICRGIKENPATSHIPVIMISARPDLMQSFTGTGAPDEFVAKPFDIDNLLSKVKKHLQG